MRTNSLVKYQIKHVYNQNWLRTPGLVIRME